MSRKKTKIKQNSSERPETQVLRGSCRGRGHVGGEDSLEEVSEDLALQIQCPVTLLLALRLGVALEPRLCTAIAPASSAVGLH